MCPKVGQAWTRGSFCSLAQACQAGECSLQVRKDSPQTSLVCEDEGFPFAHGFT